MKKLVTIAMASAVLLASTIVFAAAGFSDVPVDHLQREDIDYAVAQEWFFGYEDGTFKPDKIITQKQIVTVVNRAFPEGATRADLATFMRAGQQALNEAQSRRARISVADGASIAEICEAMQAGYESDKAQGRIGRAGEFVTGLSVYSHIENACRRDRYIGDHGIDAQRFIREIACTNESGDVNTYEQEFTVSTSNRYIYKQAFATIDGNKRAVVDIRDFVEHCARNRCLNSHNHYSYSLRSGEYNICSGERMKFEAPTTGRYTVTSDRAGTRQGTVHRTIFGIEITPTPGAELPETVHLAFRSDDGSQNISTTVIIHRKMPVCDSSNPLVAHPVLQYVNLNGMLRCP